MSADTRASERWQESRAGGGTFQSARSLKRAEQRSMGSVALGSAQTPWLIGGQSLQTWPVLPDELQANISSSYEAFDALMG